MTYNVKNKLKVYQTSTKNRVLSISAADNTDFVVSDILWCVESSSTLIIGSLSLSLSLSIIFLGDDPVSALLLLRIKLCLWISSMLNDSACNFVAALRSPRGDTRFVLAPITFISSLDRRYHWLMWMYRYMCVCIGVESGDDRRMKRYFQVRFRERERWCSSLSPIIKTIKSLSFLDIPVKVFFFHFI